MCSYKYSDGFFPGIASVGGLIVGEENRGANTNVKIHQKDTLERIISRLETQSRVVFCSFRADCGSFSSSILEYVKEHCEHFRLMVQMTLVNGEDPEQESEGVFGTVYVYLSVINSNGHRRRIRCVRFRHRDNITIRCSDGITLRAHVSRFTYAPPILNIFAINC